MAKDVNVTQRHILLFIWKYSRKHLPLITVLFIFSVLSAGVHLSQPYLYKEAIDALHLDGGVASYERALLMFLLGLGAAILGFTFHEGATLMISWLQAKVLEQIYTDVFSHVQRLSTKFHVNTFAGATARRIGRGVDGVENILDRVWFNFLPAILFIIILTSILFRFSHEIGIIMFIGIMVYALISITLNLILARLFRWADKQDTEVTANMVDSITGNALVKAFAMHGYEQGRHEEIVSEWKRRTLTSWWCATSFAWIQSIALLLLELFLIVYALRLWRDGSFSAGSVVMITFYMGHMWGYMRQIGNNVRDYMRGVGNCEEMVHMFHEPVEIDDRDNAKPLVVTDGAIAFRHVEFQYESGPRVLFDDLTLEMKPRETIALVGHSGGGKTSLTKLLMRLYEIQKGAILIDEQNIADVTQESLRGSMSLVPQDPILFHRTIAENIAYACPGATYKQVERAAKLAHAHDFIVKLPVGYGTLVGERGVKLSGGERQRIAIARAILANKPILILDESTSSLDSVSEKYIQDALKHLMENRTSIIIAHRLSTVRRCDRIAVLDEGKLIAYAPHEELLETCAIYGEMVALQSEGMLGE